MGYECIRDCQIEMSPGVFKYIVTGQTELELGMPIDYVKPISRRYFRLTGDDVRKDVQDKKRIRKALDKRRLKYPNSANTSDLATILAKDNANRGITNLESLEIEAPTSHFADEKIIKAKARIDELYGLSGKMRRPYGDEDSIDTLQKMIDDKELEIVDDDSSDDSDKDEKADIAELQKWLKAQGVKYHHNAGLKTLRDLKEVKQKELDEDV